MFSSMFSFSTSDQNEISESDKVKSTIVDIHSREVVEAEGAKENKENKAESTPDIIIEITEPLMPEDVKPIVKILTDLTHADEVQKEEESMDQVGDRVKKCLYFSCLLIEFGLGCFAKAYAKNFWGKDGPDYTSHLQDPLAFNIGTWVLSGAALSCLLSCIVPPLIDSCQTLQRITYAEAKLTVGDRLEIEALAKNLNLIITPDLPLRSLIQQISDEVNEEKQKEKQNIWGLGVCDILKNNGIFRPNNSIQPQAGIILGYTLNYEDVAAKISKDLDKEASIEAKGQVGKKKQIRKEELGKEIKVNSKFSNYGTF